MQSMLADPKVAGRFWSFNAFNDGPMGVFMSQDFGSTWTLMHRGNDMTGRAWGAAIDPNPAYAGSFPTLYAPNGYGNQGLFKSTDGGTTWVQLFSPGSVFDPFSLFGGLPDVYSVYVLPDNPPNHLLVTFHANWLINGVFSDAGLGESLDGGVTWIVHMPPAQFGGSHYLAIWDSTHWFAMSQWGDNTHGLWATSTAGRTGGQPATSAWKQVDTIEHSHGTGQFFVDAKNSFIYFPHVFGIKRVTWNGSSFSAPADVYDTGEGAVIGTPNFLYTSDRFNVRLARASRALGTDWTPQTTPGALMDGASPRGYATAFDGTHWYVLGAFCNSGIWRWIEP